jgi:hypothetical protein
MGTSTAHQKASTMSAKVVAVRHIWWHTMQHCQRGDESVRETLWKMRSIEFLIILVNFEKQCSDSVLARSRQNLIHE